MKVLHEESHALPLVELELAFRGGSLSDPESLPGRARMMARVMRMGIRRQQERDVDNALAELGARLSVGVSTSAVRLRGVVLARNFERFVALIASLVQAPAFRQKDIARVKRETESALVAFQDDDRGLARRAFLMSAYEGHPYAQRVSGGLRSVKAIKRADLLEAHAALIGEPNAFFAVSGPVSRAEVGRVMKRYFRLPRSLAKPDRVRALKNKRGLRIVVVHKDERTQAQMFIGTLASAIGDKHTFGLMVGNAAFGGTFTARLSAEIRGNLGYSYAAYSRLSQRQGRGTFSMWTHPSNENAKACATRQLELYREFAERGITKREVSFVKKMLVRGHCFDRDTAHKRLDAALDVAVSKIPRAHVFDYEALVSKVDQADVKDALRARLSTRDLTMSVVMDKEAAKRAFSELPGVSALTVIEPHALIR